MQNQINQPSRTSIQKPSQNSESNKKIVGLLAKCHLAQNTYGKQAADFTALVAIFLEFIPYPPETIVKALEEWIVASPNFPTPFDIKCLCEKRLEADYNPIQEEIKRFHAAGFDFVNESHFENLNVLFDAVTQVESDKIKVFRSTVKTPSTRKGIEWEIKRISSVYPELFRGENAVSEWCGVLKDAPYAYLERTVKIVLSQDKKPDLKTIKAQLDELFRIYGAAEKPQPLTLSDIKASLGV